MAKCAFITGASNGIGKGIALKLAEDGYDVAFTYASNLKAAEAVKAQIEGFGRRTFFYQADLREADAPQRHMVYDKTVHGNIIFITTSRGERAYADDFIYGMTKAALTRACQSIAIDLSPYGIRINCVAPGATWTHEGAANASLKNGGIPMGRLGTPKDTADLVAYLISDAAWMIDGISVRIDGGLILSGLPEGWAEAKFIDPAWIEKQHDAVVARMEGEAHES